MLKYMLYILKYILGPQKIQQYIGPGRQFLALSVKETSTIPSDATCSECIPAV